MWPFISDILRALLAADVSLFKLINCHHTPFLDGFFAVVGLFGNGWVITPVFLAAVVLWAPRSRRVRIIVFAVVVFIVGGLANTLSKRVFDRPRPAACFTEEPAPPQPGAGPPFTVHIVGDRLVSYSFPSGHSHTAFTIAVLVVLIWGKRFWPGFIVAALAAYSRAYVGAHFPVDILIGGLMGGFISWGVWCALARFSRPRPGG